MNVKDPMNREIAINHVNTGRQSVSAALRDAAQRLGSAADSPSLDAELLLCRVLSVDRAALYAHPDRILSEKQSCAYRELIARRAFGEPLPYLVGRHEFFGLDLIVNRDVLIPRPETELLVELGRGFLNASPDLGNGNSARSYQRVVVDVGTGSGCIAVALAVHAPQARFYAVDVSTRALDVARQNVRRNGVSEQINLVQSDLLQALPEKADLIIANLPYVDEMELFKLPISVRQHEPHTALLASDGGLAVIKRLLEQAPAHLRPNGCVLLEVGATQGEAVTRLATAAFPDAEVSCHRDLFNRPRIVHVQTLRSPA
jgi:release factor glutamine methyltransferase